MSVKRVKIHYMPAADYTPPAEKIPIQNGYMEKLNQSIQQKVKQNRAERDASIAYARNYLVK